MPKQPDNIRNYFLCRERDYWDIAWLRPTDLAGMELKHPVVLINGAFDILHSTHMRLIFAARRKAGTLLCALDSDEKVKREKGEQRPICTFIERAVALNYMPLDGIIEVDDKRDMNRIMKVVDLRVQGYDYKDVPSRYKIKKMLCREGTLHTSVLIERIRERYVSK